MKTPTRRTAEEKAAQKDAMSKKADEGLERLAQALATAGTTESMREYLGFLSHFHRYSARNQWLIWCQAPEASRVAGFHTWKNMGRTVKKGEKGIAIFAPAGLGRREETTKNRETGQEETTVHTWQRFRVAYVFDQAQTEGEPLPEHPATNREGADPALVLRVRAAIATLCPIREDEAAEARGCRGWTNGKEIHLVRGLSLGAQLAVLIHEAAHFVLHFTEAGARPTNLPHRDLRELEAEATACAVSAALGYDFGGFSAAYLHGYGATPESLKEALPRIAEATAKLLGMILGAGSVEEAEERAFA